MNFFYNLPMWARLNIARSKPPSKALPMKIDAYAARAMRTCMFIFPPAMFTTASSADEIWKIEDTFF